MNKKEIKCFFVGHQDDDKYNYGYCPHCEKDYNAWIETLHNKIYRWKFQIYIWFSRKFKHHKKDANGHLIDDLPF